MFGGFRGFGGPDVGSAIVRIGADYSGLRTQTHAAVAQVKAELATIGRGLNSVPGQSPVTQLNRDLDGAIHRTNRLRTVMKGIALGGGLFAITGIGAAIKAAIDFESAFAGVEKTVEGSKEELAALRKEFIQMSLEMPVAATSLARVGEAAGALGIPKAAIKDFVKVVSTIGSTTDVSVEDAATSLGQLSNILKLTTGDYQRFAATLVDLGNKGASTESQILEIAKRFGGSARLFGLDAKEVLALASSAANLGMQPELAGSTLSRLVDRLTSISGSMKTVKDLASAAGMSVAEFTKNVEAGGKTLDAMSESTGLQNKQLTNLLKSGDSLAVLQGAIGMTDKQFQKLKRTDPGAIFTAMFQAMSGMDASGRQLFVQGVMGPAATAGGGSGMTRLVMGLADSIDTNLIPSLRNAKTAWQEQTAANVEAAKRYKTTASQWQQLQNIVTATLIGVGDTFLPTVVEGLSAIAERLPGIFQSLGDLYKKHLEGPFTAVRDAAARLLESLSRILFDWGKGGAGESVTEVFDLLARSVGVLAKGLTQVLDVLNAIMGNAVMQGLGKVVVLLGAAALAMRGLAGLRSLLGGAANGLLRMFSFGRLGQTAGSTDPAAAMQQSAATQQMAAAELQMRAAAMEAATAPLGAAAQTGLLAPGRNSLGGALISGDMVRTRANQRIQYVGGNPAAAMAGGWGRQELFTPYASYLGNRSTGVGSLSEAGFKVAKTGMARYMEAIGTGAGRLVSAGRSVLGTLGGVAMRGVRLISRVFWPLFVADLLLNLASAPIGDFIRRSTGFKRVADAWGKGWLEGMQASVESYMLGTDAFVGRPSSYAVGDREISTDSLKALSRAIPDLAEKLRPALDRIQESAPGSLDSLGGLMNLTQILSQSVGGFPSERKSGESDNQWATRAAGWTSGLVMLARDLGVLTPEQYGEYTTNPDIMIPKSQDGRLVPSEKIGELYDRLIDTAGGLEAQFRKAAEDFRAALVSTAREAGLDIPGYLLGRMNTDQLDQAGKLFQTESEPPAWLRTWALGQIAGGGTTPYTGGGSTVGEAVGLGDVGKDLKGWLDWRSASAQKYGANYEWMQRFFEENGQRIEMADSMGTEARANLIEAILGPSLKARGVKFDSKNKKMVDRFWTEEILPMLSDAKVMLGIDQREQIAGRIHDGLVTAMFEGMSIKPEEWKAITQGLWDGLGPMSTDVTTRLGDVISDWWKQGLADGIKPKDMVDRFNKMFAEVPGFKPARDKNDLQSAVIATYADEFMNADDEGDKNRLTGVLTKRFPKVFKNWVDIEKMFTGKSGGSTAVQRWVRIFEEMGTQAETAMGQVDTATSLGTTWMDDFKVAVEGAPKPTAPTPFVDLLSGFTGGAAWMRQFAEGMKSVSVTVPTPTTGGGLNGGGRTTGRDIPETDDPVGGGLLNSMRTAVNRSLAGALAPAAPRLAMAGAMALPDGGVGGQGGASVYQRTQTLYVNHLSVVGPESEGSILAQLSFMDPGA